MGNQEICIASELNELPPLSGFLEEDICNMISTGKLVNEANKNYPLLSEYAKKYLSKARLSNIYVEDRS